MAKKPSSMNPFNLGQTEMLAKEEMLAVEDYRRIITVGIPKGMQDIDYTVPLTPESVELLTRNNHRVYIENGAGMTANYTDNNYSERGGIITGDRAQVFSADIILKCSPFTCEESELLRGSQVLISSLHKDNNTKDFIKKLISKRTSAIAFENINDNSGLYPIEQSLNAISGTASILLAGELLSKKTKGKGVLLGSVAGITPTEIVILGAGTAGEFAARAAIGMGASVKVFDNSISRLQILRDKLGQHVYTSVYFPQVLQKALKSAEVVIGALPNDQYTSSLWVSEELVKEMKKDSIIIDLNVARGGCFETSELRTLKDPVFTKFGVIHYCAPNITSRVSRTASIALSNIFSSMLIRMDQQGGIVKLLKKDTELRQGVYLFNGILTNSHIGQHYDLPYQDIGLLLSAF